MAMTGTIEGHHRKDFSFMLTPPSHVEFSWDCDNEDCDSCSCIANENCMLLQGLSEAKNLTLVAETKMFIFRREWCPVFKNLKTLLLNEFWCVPADLSALACILEHSPVIQRLILQLFSKGPKHKVQMKGSRRPSEISAAMLKHLEIVEVKCEVVDERVLNVLKFLGRLNICKITIGTYVFSYLFKFKLTAEWKI
uniref:FBD domain-containing protein n=1 Tax=Leersia perrieri TaxID=77586 RepID=A0A0D9XQ51_9ORYZ